MTIDLSLIEKAYKRQFLAFGDCAQGFFWARPKDAEIRSRLLVEIIRKDESFCVDFGCGSGDLIPFLEEKGMVGYVGVDICDVSREVAALKYPHIAFLKEVPDMKFDYGFVSGTYNYKDYLKTEEWERWVESSIKQLWSQVDRGLAMNFLTYKPDWIVNTLWYPKSPQQIVDWVPGVKKLQVIENYGLKAEWTLFLEKE